MDIFFFIPGYERAIYDTGREPAFVMFLSFLITYLLTRGYTRIARVRGWGSAIINGVHVHHMVFGLVIAFAAAALMFGYLPQSPAVILLLASAFGIGASLVLDEFALIFYLDDVYWEEEGRKSIDAIVLAASICALFLMGTKPLGFNPYNPMWFIFLGIVLNLLFVILAAMKGKNFLAIFGVFIPLVALVGALRIASPNSIWARKFYVSNPLKLKKSMERHESFGKKWQYRKQHVWDLIGGKTGRP